MRVGTVPGPRISAARGEGARGGQVPVPPVHMVGPTGGGLVQPDAKDLT